MIQLKKSKKKCRTRKKSKGIKINDKMKLIIQGNIKLMKNKNKKYEKANNN